MTPMRSSLCCRKIVPLLQQVRGSLLFLRALTSSSRPFYLKIPLGLCSEDPLEYFNREVQKRRDEEANLWSTPGDPSHSEREDDRVLYGLLQARNKTRMGSTVRGNSTSHTDFSFVHIIHCVVTSMKGRKIESS